MNTVELNSINLQSIDVASNNVSSIGKSIKRNKSIKLLPAGYQQVEYIQSQNVSYNNGQYIDTLCYPNPTFFRIKGLAEYTKITNNGAIFGSKATSYFESICLRGNFNLIVGGGDYNPYSTSIDVGQLIQFDIKTDNNICYYTINEHTDSTSVNLYNIVSPNSMKLFCRDDVGTMNCFGNIKLYELQIYSYSNTLVRNFIPCYRILDNEIGMYDTVNDVFYTNQGTGTFIKGPDKNDKTDNKPYIKGHITTSDSTFTFSVDGNNKTVLVDANGDFKLKVRKSITSLSFVGVPQLESLELFKIDGVTTFDVDYPTDVTFIKCDNTTISAKNDVYHIRGTATDDFNFTLKYIDGSNNVTEVTESAVIDENGKWDVSYSGKNIRELQQTFKNNTYLTSIEITDGNKIVSLDYAFQNAANVSSIIINSILPKVTSANYVFNGCSNLELVNSEKWELPLLTTIYSGFANCSKIEIINLSKISFENTTNVGGLFTGCSLLERVIFKNGIKINNASNSFSFNGCVKLKTFNLESAEFKKATGMAYMFYRCGELQEINLQSLSTDIMSDFSGAFHSCSNLEVLKLNNATFESATTLNNGFAYGANKLTDLYLPNTAKMAISINFATNPLTYESMLRIANWLKDLSGETTQTVTFKTSAYNALTSEQKAELEGIIVTQKGWVLATA